MKQQVFQLGDQEWLPAGWGDDVLPNPPDGLGGPGDGRGKGACSGIGGLSTPSLKHCPVLLDGPPAIMDVAGGCIHAWVHPGRGLWGGLGCSEHGGDRRLLTRSAGPLHLTLPCACLCTCVCSPRVRGDLLRWSGGSTCGHASKHPHPPVPPQEPQSQLLIHHQISGCPLCNLSN